MVLLFASFFVSQLSRSAKLEILLHTVHCRAEKRVPIESFLEDQAFLRSYDSAPRPPPIPLSRQQVISFSQSSCVSPVELTDRRGGKGVHGQEPNHKTARKPGPINHSILSAVKVPLSHKV